MPFTKFNSKWIIELNVKHKAIKVLEDNTRAKRDNLGYGNGFLNTTPKTQSMEEIIISELQN